MAAIGKPTQLFTASLLCAFAMAIGPNPMPRDARLTAKHAAKFIAPAACHQKTYPVLYRHGSCNAAVETFVNTMKA